LIGCTAARFSTIQKSRKTNQEVNMFSHIMLGANNIEESKKFYDATLGALGYKPGIIDDKGRCFYFEKTGIFSLSKPIDGEPASCGNGSTVGFAVSGPEQADAWHAAGLANGGTAIEDAPGLREGSAGKLYLAYLRDPSGNKICALHRVA
jgi:catechol 2,3-dioxygenase-like lactoylglutathione lyase family enzyme